MSESTPILPDNPEAIVPLYVLRKLNDKAALADEMRAALEMVLKRWTFDNNQHHTHSWHDRTDCQMVIVPLLDRASKLAEAEEAR